MRVATTIVSQNSTDTRANSTPRGIRVLTRWEASTDNGRRLEPINIPFLVIILILMIPLNIQVRMTQTNLLRQPPTPGNN
jgi:hypothetical protein